MFTQGFYTAPPNRSDLPVYKITLDLQRRLLTVEASGFATVEEVKLFYRDVAALVAKQGWAAGEYITLFQVLDEIVQRQEVADAIAVATRTVATPARKNAVVRTGALASLQGRRIIDERTAIFATAEEAKAWLFA